MSACAACVSVELTLWRFTNSYVQPTNQDNTFTPSTNHDVVVTRDCGVTIVCASALSVVIDWADRSIGRLVMQRKGMVRRCSTVAQLFRNGPTKAEKRALENNDQTPTRHTGRTMGHIKLVYTLTESCWSMVWRLNEDERRGRSWLNFALFKGMWHNCYCHVKIDTQPTQPTIRTVKGGRDWVL